MKFEEFKYERINFEEIKETYLKYIEELENAKCENCFMNTFKEFNKYRGHIMTMMTLSSVRHTINTADEFYEAENEYWDNTSPLIQEYETKFMDVCLNTPHRAKLDIPETFFKLAEYSKKCFSNEIVSDLQEENRLTTEYGKLKAKAKIELDGEVYNLASIAPKMMDLDRGVRKRAYEAVNKFYEDNEDKFDDIYDSLVKVRTTIAHKLGYKNFTELGYYRMNRFDYDQKMVENYRNQIREDIVPLVSKLRLAQAKRIGVEKLMPYDSSLNFKSGNPTPVGDTEVLKSAALKMYKEMSKETGEYFEVMMDQDLFDLPTRPNKEMGGYCTDLFDYKVPFIFSNCNGTAGDVDVLTHEAGHGFQSYLTMKNVDIPDVAFPTMESCEIHSMSMEFFAHPWMESFFGKDADKYKYYHIDSSLSFLPYGVLVDHFQHEVYNNPEMTKEERKATWARLEKMYKPDIDYSEYPFMEKGTYWYRQNHIFQSPFYYIDYTLAQVCALQYFTRVLNKDENAWSDYVNLCKLGGTKTFTELVKVAGLKVPFEDGSLKEVATTMEKELEKYDVENL